MHYSALIGNPTGHSVSHILYVELAKAAGIKDGYAHIKINLETEELHQALESFKSLHFFGVNVTLPHKMAVMSYIDSLDPVVEQLGAVNTLKFGTDVKGYNTDWIGIYTPVNKVTETVNIATVFGSGGAARAAIYAAKELGAKKIYVLYRNDKDSGKTDDLINNQTELGITMLKYDNVDYTVKESDLIVNATSAGMIGKDPWPFEIERLNGLDLSRKVYLDAVFNPLETPLLKFFKKKGAHTIDGLWMMIFQGVAALSIWHGQSLKISDARLKSIHRLLEEEILRV